MENVVIYTTEFCPYCVQAKILLEKKGVSYEDIRLDLNPELRDEVILKSGGMRTVPSIFIGDKHVGGYNELSALDREGKLDPMLAG
jgi:glutaredoxin 3